MNASSQTPSSSAPLKSSQTPSESASDNKESTNKSSPSSAPDAEKQAEQQTSSPKLKPFIKARLRLDAFLGEWLSPDYYEAITPPPGSVLMIASAKADLLRRGEYIDMTEDAVRATSSRGHFPGGWGSDQKSNEDTPAADQSTSQGRDRANTHGSTISQRSAAGQNATTPVNSPGYLPPVPRYAVSPADPIPIGYVAHARDASIEVDYQWDSTRPPQDWGNGGEYGEEWSSMHKRFRKGLQHMISWYRIHRESAHHVGGHKRILHPHDDEEDDGDTDVVLILVTHGAGCNALIGALTNQPVLMDVGMASLTMAVRKEDSVVSNGSSAVLRNGSSHDHNLSNDYTVLLTASTEHLRAGSSPLSIPPLNQQPRHAPTFPYTHSHSISQSSASPRIPPYRYRLGPIIPTIGSSPIDSPSDSPFALPEPFSRFAISSPHGRSASVATSRTSSGLWSKPGSESSPKLQPNMEESKKNDSPFEVEKVVDGKVSDDFVAGEEDQVPALGLWGSASRDGEVQEREKGHKRRWTVTERG